MLREFAVFVEDLIFGDFFSFCNMGLRERVARAVAERLRPWLVEDANINILFSGTQVHLQLSNVNLEVSTLNKLAMGTSPLLLQAASVGEVEITLALFGSPVLALVVRGMHFVLKPRSSFSPEYGGVDLLLICSGIM